MNTISLQVATIDHVIQVMSNLREADANELKLSSGLVTKQKLINHFLKVKPVCSSFMAFIFDGEAVGLLGVVHKGHVGIIWAVGTDKLTLQTKSFHKLCSIYLSEQLTKYSILANSVWEGNIEHIKWLSRLGFTFGEMNEQGFIPFRIENV